MAACGLSARAGLGWHGSAFAHSRCSRTSRQPVQRARLHVRAAGGESEPDLSKQFSEFKRRMKASMPEVEQRTITAPPPRFSSTRKGDWNAGPPADQLRQQERAALDAWTQERGMQLAAVGTMVLVLVLLFAAGGPPSDARCTLPWC